MSRVKCPHGYFTPPARQRCPWCHGFDDISQNVIPVTGHGNGWLLRVGDAVCTSCGGPSSAGWGLIDDTVPVQSRRLPSMCYSCQSGENTKETLTRRAEHEARRGVKKQRT
jgi:hypothetical protein